MDYIRYRPEIDGLRAVAVIPVVLFHMGFQFVSGGFIGVDVFFVISGYLITSIILKENDEGVFKFSNFWLRRIRRIIPALVAMLIVTSIAGYFFIWRGDLRDLGKHGIAAILSFANIVMWRMPGGYWGTSAENSLFLHTWSLSVEEQFYFVYPFILIFILGMMRKWLFQAISAIAIISFSLYVYGSQFYPTATFYLLPMRAWELATGCLVAILAWNRGDLKYSESLSFWMSMIGIVGILFSYVFFSGETKLPGFLILPVIGSALIIVFGNSNTIVNKILSSNPFVLIGKISYSLYLWHWPILGLARKSLFIGNNIALTSIILSAMVLVSVVSYNFVEKPTRYRFNILKPTLIVCAASLVLSIFLYKFPFNTSYASTAYNKTLWKGQLYNVNPVDTWPASIKARMEGIDVPEREKSQASAYLTGGIIKRYGRLSPEVVVLGDSHVLMWSGVIDNICEELGLTVSFYGADGTSPFIKLPLKTTNGNLFFTSEEKHLFDTKRLDYIKEWKPKIVFLVSSWGGVKDIKEAEDLVQFIGEVGSKIILIEQPPVLFFGDKNAVHYLSFMNVLPKTTQKQYVKIGDMHTYEAGRELIRNISSKYSYCSVIPVKDVFYKEGAGSWALDGSNVLYIDDDHLSQAGALKLKDRIHEKIKNIVVL